MVLEYQDSLELNHSNYSSCMKHIGGYFILFNCQRLHRVRVHIRVHKVRCTCVHVLCTEMPCAQSVLYAGSIRVTSMVQYEPHCMRAEPRSWEVRGVHSELWQAQYGTGLTVWVQSRARERFAGYTVSHQGTIKAEPRSWEVRGVPGPSDQAL